MMTINNFGLVPPTALDRLKETALLSPDRGVDPETVGSSALPTKTLDGSVSAKGDSLRPVEASSQAPDLELLPTGNAGQGMEGRLIDVFA